MIPISRLLDEYPMIEEETRATEKMLLELLDPH